MTSDFRRQLSRGSILALMFGLLWTATAALGQDTQIPTTAQTRAALTGPPPEPLWRVLVEAMLVGTTGSAAFYVGVWLGFISRGSRTSILEHLHRQRADLAPLQAMTVLDWVRLQQQAKSQLEERARLIRVAVLCLFGGFVAAAFQWAQPDRFIPIQAFVLGATWPSVVTRVMAGNDSGGTPSVTPPTISAPPTPGPSGVPSSQTTVTPPVGEIVIQPQPSDVRKHAGDGS